MAVGLLLGWQRLHIGHWTRPSSICLSRSSAHVPREGVPQAPRRSRGTDSEGESPPRASASGAVEDDGVGELNVSLDVRLRFLFYQLVRALNWCHQNGVSLGGAFSVSAYPAFAHPDQTPCATHMKLFRATHSYPRLLPM